MNCMRELPQEYLETCPVIDQKYRLLFRLGIGRFSNVKLAVNLATNQRVAVKILNHPLDSQPYPHPRDDEEHHRTVDALLNEVQMCCEARHRHVAEVIDFNVGGFCRTSDGLVHRVLYYVMRVQEHGQLFRVISQTEPFSERTARHIFRQLLATLSNTHRQRIAHCDIKSENILLDRRFSIKLVDFGCARYLADEQGAALSYCSEEAVGTPKCHPPEITNGESALYCPEALDVFAAGCFLFELVMKSEPFKSSHAQDLFYSKLVNDRHSQFWAMFNSKTAPSNQFKDLVEGLLNPHPKHRFTIQQAIQHPWTQGDVPKKEDYRKEMKARLKKVMVRVRKEQEQQMKQTFIKEKNRNHESGHRLAQPSPLPPATEQRIVGLRTLLATREAGSGSSQSDCSSQQDYQSKGKAKQQKKGEAQRRTAGQIQSEPPPTKSHLEN